MTERISKRKGMGKRRKEEAKARQYRLATPKDFDLRNTMESHGWYDLLPFRYDAERASMTYTFRPANGGGPQTVNISEGVDGRIVVKTTGIGRKDAAQLVNRLFRMDEPLDEFYEAVNVSPGLKWVERAGAGRLLRSATVFEDLVKTICTTNCSWGLTKKMVSNLVEMLGESSASGEKAFPTPEAMAGAGIEFFRNEIRAGYRASYLAELAEAVLTGKIDPESWLSSDLPTKELRSELTGIKGVGDYAADALLKLLGHYDGLALDSWLRAGFYKKHNRGRKCADSKIERHYKRFGKWKGLAIWCDMTESWFEGRLNIKMY